MRFPFISVPSAIFKPVGLIDQTGRILAYFRPVGKHVQSGLIYVFCEREVGFMTCFDCPRSEIDDPFISNVSKRCEGQFLVWLLMAFMIGNEGLLMFRN